MRVWEPLILDVLIAEVIPLSKMDMTNCLRIALDAACCLGCLSGPTSSSWSKSAVPGIITTRCYSSERLKRRQAQITLDNTLSPTAWLGPRCTRSMFSSYKFVWTLRKRIQCLMDSPLGFLSFDRVQVEFGAEKSTGIPSQLAWLVLTYNFGSDFLGAR